MSLCRVCMADIVWCETEDGDRVPLDEHEQEMTGEGRWRIVDNRQPRPLVEPVDASFPVLAMVDHRTICQKPRIVG